MAPARMHLGEGEPHIVHPAPTTTLATDAAGRLSDTPSNFPGKDPVPDVDAPLHVSPHEDGWIVSFEGSTDAAAIVPTKKEAMAIAHKLAKERDLRVVEHGADGKIR